MQGAERREHERRKVLKVEVRVASTDAFRASYLRDLSLGGLFVRSKKPLEQGTAVVIELVVTGLPQVRLAGEVVRHETDRDGTPRGFGVRFSTVDATTQAALKEIIAAASEPVATEPEADVAMLQAELAEMRGTIEAYEESMASLRERETELQLRVERIVSERALLAEVARDLQTRVKDLESERAGMASKLDTLVGKLAQGDAEARKIRDSSAKLSADLQMARAQLSSEQNKHAAAAALLAKELANTSAEAELHRQSLEEEVEALRTQLKPPGDETLRAELQELSAQLDDERLKSMALERALQRFASMGGVIPPR